MKLADFLYYQLLLILIEDIVRSISKKIKEFTLKIERVTFIWMFVCFMNFWAARNSKKWSLGLFRPNLYDLGLFHPYFVCKYSFIEISMIKMVSTSFMFYKKNSEIKGKKVIHWGGQGKWRNHPNFVLEV